MFNINDIKNGITFKYEGQIFEVLDFMHVKPGKGPAFMKIKMKNLRTGTIVEKTFNTNIKFEQAIIDKKPMQFLYIDGTKYNFMNMDTYEQVAVDKEQIGNDVAYLSEGLETNLIFYEGELLGLLLPDKVNLKVVETSDAVKGNTATNAMKDARTESGLVVKVPLFINQDETIIVSTYDGKYVSRA